MKITPKFKSLLVEKHGLPQGSDDAAARAHAGKCYGEGTLDFDCPEVKAAMADTPAALRPEVESAIGAAVSKAIAAALPGHVPQAAVTNHPNTISAPAATSTADAGANPGVPAKGYAMGSGTSGGDGDEAQVRIRVKSAAERYDDTRTAATWSKSANPYMQSMYAGQPISAGIGDGGYNLDVPTPRSKAVAGAFFKHLARKSLRAQGIQIPDYAMPNQHEKDLLAYTVNECKFVGPISHKSGRRDTHDSGIADEWLGAERLDSDLMRKAVLDDSVSGGLEAVPIEFDAAVIFTPLLNGELFPLVTLRNVGRRRIEATKIGNVTVNWGPASGTAIAPFDTDSLISAFDNSIYNITGACEMGLDFLGDSPLNVGEAIVAEYGKAFLKAMDDVIATGDGTTQPEGLFTASGTGTATAVGTSSAPKVGDYEALCFGIAKQFRNEAGARQILLSTDTNYKRSRGIPVDSSSDERRVFGMNQMSYSLFDLPYRVNAGVNALKVGSFMMNRYRMYRRQGLEVTYVRNGTDFTLTRRNVEGLVVRARFGGALELGGAGVVLTYNS